MADDLGGRDLPVYGNPFNGAPNIDKLASQEILLIIGDAMIEHVDKTLGDLMNTHEKRGLADNTVFIFFSDNGGVDNHVDNIPLLLGASMDVYPIFYDPECEVFNHYPVYHHEEPMSAVRKLINNNNLINNLSDEIQLS